MAGSPTTRPSLLVRLRDARDGQAWAQFVDLYAPLVYGFARKHGLQDADAADVTQDVLRSVAGAVDRLDYDPDWAERPVVREAKGRLQRPRDELTTGPELRRPPRHRGFAERHAASTVRGREGATSARRSRTRAGVPNRRYQQRLLDCLAGHALPGRLGKCLVRRAPRRHNQRIRQRAFFSSSARPTRSPSPARGTARSCRRPSLPAAASARPSRRR
jgi:DNA-directed RNA polymerase specialized sigma24 family protein